MKKLKNLKLNKLSQSELDEKELQQLKGGTGPCICGCCYSGSGGSSTFDNGLANCQLGKSSTCGEAVYTVC